MVVKRSPVQHVARPEPPESLAALVAANERLQRFAAELAGEQQRAQVERSWLRTMIDQVPDYLYIKDKDARFVIANRAVAIDLGHGDPNTLIGKSDLDVHPMPLARRYYEDDMSVIGGKALIDHEEYVIRPDGTQLWLSTSKLPLRNPEGAIIGLVGSARDITERRRAEAHMHFLAYHDSLTGLPNRAQFERDLGRLATNAAAGTPATLVLIDLDRFKHINDTLGHVAGDDLLRQLANRLFQLVGPAGTLARVGGDEFAILLAGPAAGAAESLCAAIQLQFGRPFRLFDDPAFITASFGIAPWRPGSDAFSMLREADIALYEAKARGRGRWQVFAPPMAEMVEEKRRIEQDLRRALTEGGQQLTLEYQPIFAADGRSIVGAEALVRWDHPERGRLAPDVFIGVAEERGLIEKLGEWVFGEACSMLASTAIPWVAVNVSPVELKSRRFVDRVIETLRERSIDPKRLQLEITEGVLLDTSEATEAGLTRLREAGIRLALDDFGTGYSSLNYLRRYNVDKLKIDQSFVGQLGDSADAEVIVRTIIDLARSLKMRVTAEGVATEGQRDYLVAHGCHELQGFLLSQPLPLEAFLEFSGIAA
jgi:diguanylate cyclase (GGDEF)-like protein/PAS domain S-box-containing protein